MQGLSCSHERGQQRPGARVAGSGRSSPAYARLAFDAGLSSSGRRVQGVAARVLDQEGCKDGGEGYWYSSRHWLRGEVVE